MSIVGVALRRGGRADGAKTAMLVSGLVAPGFVVLIADLRVAFENPSLRASIETGLTLCAGISAWLFRARFDRTRRASDLLVLMALLTLGFSDLEFFAAPAVLGLQSTSFGATAPLVARLLVAVLFTAAALAPRELLVTRQVKPIPLIGAIAICVGGIGIGALLLGDHTVWSAGAEQHAPSGRHVVLTVAAGMLLLLSAVAFARRCWTERAPVSTMLAGACALFAAAWCYDLLVPVLTPGWVSGREGLRAVAYGLVLLAAVRSFAPMRLGDAEQQAAAAERQRLARDLHDGLAQDLAFIAAHGERMAQEHGSEHPIAIAARRALAASRGAIADLAAADAPTAAAALKSIADELASRHHVVIAVRTDDTELTADEREQLIRIARESIANAIQHGRARHIDVSLMSDDNRLVLRVYDDGCGIGDGASKDRHRGLGMHTMRERAHEIGGRLSARQRVRGGTVVEVVV